MRRLPLFRALGLALVGLMALTIGSRPSLRAQVTDSTVATAAVAGAFGGDTDDDEDSVPLIVVQPAIPSMSLAATRVWLRMQEKLTLSFPNDTPLEDILKYIRKATEQEDEFPKGIPIYLEPQGLQDADKTAASPVSIDLEGIPLATSLKLALKQLGLGYYIHEDGILVITDLESILKTDTNHKILEELAALRTEVRALREEVRSHSGPPRNQRTTPKPGRMGGAMRGRGNVR